MRIRIRLRRPEGRQCWLQLGRPLQSYRRLFYVEPLSGPDDDNHNHDDHSNDDYDDDHDYDGYDHMEPGWVRLWVEQSCSGSKRLSPTTSSITR